MEKKILQIALTMIPGLGVHSCRQLMELLPDPTDVFSMSRSDLREYFGKHDSIISSIESKSMIARAEEEYRWAEDKEVQILFATDEKYPQRLNRNECADCPVLLYYRGDADLNNTKMLSVVGTRRATEYGKDMTNYIIGDLREQNITIVSGLAYGIDAAAHRAALSTSLPTIGVLAHGLDQIYPADNRQLAVDMMKNGGGLITEYPSQTKITPGYFPARNRVIAALSDATIVMEANEKGGALITASIANSYQRDVFAVPGRITDKYSTGCNNLIAANRAIIARNANDILDYLNWPRPDADVLPSKQTTLFPTLSHDEQTIVTLLSENPDIPIEQITQKTNLSLPKVANALLNLELSNVIRCLPGKLYRLV